MKKAFFFSLAILTSTLLSAQNDSSAHLIKSMEKIPDIKVYIVPDSTSYSNENIQKNKPFILMFFSPECEHCQRETKELLAYKEELKNVQILMVSVLPFKEIKEFYDSYGLAAMPNVKLGQDLNMKLGILYKVRTFPTMYVYNKSGSLEKIFVSNTGVPEILQALR